MKTLPTNSIDQFASHLQNARLSSKSIEPFSKIHGEYSLDDAYKVQRRGIELRQEAGEKIIGYKMGLTSKAKMDQMGLHTPIFGVLTDAMTVTNNGVFPVKERIHPKAEPEIYFVTNRELKGTLKMEDVPSVCERIGVALEILDSRYVGFKYFSLPDVVADNASSSHFVLGDSVKGSAILDWPALTIQLKANGGVKETATGAAILGHPFRSLCALIDLLAKEGKSLPAGSIVLAGAATTAIALEAGQTVAAQIDGIGTVEFRAD